MPDPRIVSDRDRRMVSRSASVLAARSRRSRGDLRRRPRADSCTVRLMNAGPATVVSLSAWGDLRDGSSGGTSCDVRESALLSDGREVSLLDDRGWTTSAQLGEISLAHVVRNVYNVVLPDDAEETGEEHEWQRFEQRLREAGVPVTRDELRAVPYRVILTVPSGSARWHAV
jgi:hypothetical protein